MKLIHSHLQQLLPGLNIEPQKLRDDLTMIGHFTNYYEKIGNEIVFDLDIKVNRGDCLGYYGIARDLSVLYNIPLKTPNIDFSLTSKNVLPIKINSPKVTRVQAIKLIQVKNGPSPEWLINFLALHGSNSINLVVDLTNFIMFYYGIPNHAFDIAKSTENLIWELNPRYEEFTSLDGTTLKLNSDILMINNPLQPLSLSFWGGQACAIDEKTTDIIIEMAVYDKSTVRQNSRFLKSTTEAGVRLEKDLDPNLIPLALGHLVKLLQELGQATIDSQLFDYYPHHQEVSSIKFNFDSPSRIAGIEIPPAFVLDCLQRLGCKITDDLIIPPTIRPDITLEEDLVEEIVRFFGYQKIPTDQPLTKKNLPDITPKIIYLVEKLKDELVSLGYDEVLTWPLDKKPQPNMEAAAIYTQNSINSDYPVLRQAITRSLEHQLGQYIRYKLPKPQFFEIGKTFNLVNGQFVEQTSLGIYNSNLIQLQQDLDALSLKGDIKGGFFEIVLDDLPLPDSYSPKIIDNQAVELTSQIITLDANVTLEGQQNHKELVEKYTQLIGTDILWSLEIIDIYQDRYTFRACYYNCDDKTAKSIHLKSFGLAE